MKIKMKSPLYKLLFKLCSIDIGYHFYCFNFSA